VGQPQVAGRVQPGSSHNSANPSMHCRQRGHAISISPALKGLGAVSHSFLLMIMLQLLHCHFMLLPRNVAWSMFIVHLMFSWQFYTVL
jgi:hypothetical protein